MFISNYALPVHAADRIAQSFDLKLLFAMDAAGPRRDLLVWRHALSDPALTAALARPDWPLQLLAAMPPGRWPWALRIGEDERDTDPARIASAVEAASGAAAPPRGNVHVTLELRDYRDRGDTVGSAEWWSTRLPGMAAGTMMGAGLAAAMGRLHRGAALGGSALFTEQLSIVLCKDGREPASTLTPTLHADAFYGLRETAVASLLEAGWEGFGGAMYMPTRRMAELWPMRPITLETLAARLAHEPVLRTASGDVLIYDGMLDADGVARPENGIPHISPDLPGASARLALLMHHRRVA